MSDHKRGFTIEGYGLGCNTAGPKHGLFVIFNLYRISEIGPVNMSYTYVLRSTDVDRGAVCGWKPCCLLYTSDAADE